MSKAKKKAKLSRRSPDQRRSDQRLQSRVARSRVAGRSGSQQPRRAPQQQAVKSDVAVECGWGRLIFAPTFSEMEKIAEILKSEKPGQRDIVFYLSDPHVVLAYAPQQLFLDPSHTYRIWMEQYRPSRRRPQGFFIRRLNSREDIRQSNAILAKCHMMTLEPEFVWKNRRSRVVHYLVAEDFESGEILGVVCGVDHMQAFSDPENGSSLWSLAVEPNCPYPGVGEYLSRHLAETFLARGRAFMDLSVMHNNHQAIKLYEKIGFTRINVFSIKRKNVINEPLFTAPAPEESTLNPYAQIIIDEARKRGIEVEILDADAAYFRLRFGGRSIICRESLTELTTAIAMSRCDDKRVTHRLLSQAGLKVPHQQLAAGSEENQAFLQLHQRVVVKPIRGEQGQGVAVDLRSPQALEKAIDRARQFCPDVLLEEMAEGQDLRIVVIDYKVVAASLRRPPQVVGTGRHSLGELLEVYNRRRRMATRGESQVPLDSETERCLEDAGYSLSSVLPKGEKVILRKTANLHTGGTIHDVTDKLHLELRRVAERAAQVISIPVVGFDLIVKDPAEDTYAIIEANERPGLANHEPQPTAERFVDLLFPQTVFKWGYETGQGQSPSPKRGHWRDSPNSGRIL